MCGLYALLNDWLLWLNIAFAGPKPGCENVEGVCFSLFLVCKCYIVCVIMCGLFALLNDWLLWLNTAFAGPKPGCENVEGAALILHLLDCVSCMLCLNDWCVSIICVLYCCGLTLPLPVPSPNVKMWRELQ